MLLALWSAYYPFNGGKLGWYSDRFASVLEEEKIPEFVEEYFDELVLERKPQPKKIIKQLSVPFEPSSEVIEQAIEAAMERYDRYLADRRKKRNRAVLLLLN